MSASDKKMMCGFALLAIYNQRSPDAKRSDAEQAELEDCIMRAKRAGIDDTNIASLFDVELSDVQAVTL